MPELDIVVMGMCQTNEYWEREVSGSRGDTYTTYFGRAIPEVRGVHYDYACTCPDFQYRRSNTPGAYCKHIREHRSERCGWDQLMTGGEITRDDEDEPICPDCGGPATFYRAGV